MIEYINNGTTTVISEVSPEHQCRLLQLIGLSLKKEKSVQYDFTEALEAFTILSPKDKRREINTWIAVMERILNRSQCEHSKENQKIKIRDIC